MDPLVEADQVQIQKNPAVFLSADGDQLWIKYTDDGIGSVSKRYLTDSIQK